MGYTATQSTNSCACHSLEGRFARIDSPDARDEFKKEQDAAKKIPAEIKKPISQAKSLEIIGSLF